MISAQSGHRFGIVDIGYALPSCAVSSKVIAEMHGFDLAFIEDKLGISQRYIVGPNESTATLATKAAQTVLSGRTVPRIGLLVLVTQTPDHLLPHTSALVHQALGLDTDCAVFDISLGCSGWVYGMACTLALMESRQIENALLITADTYSRIMDRNDRATAPLFGDAATATLLGPNPIYTLGRCTFGSDGSRHEALIARSSGVDPKPAQPLFMNGREIFNFLLREIPSDVSRCLELNAVDKNAIDIWVFHQASRFMLDSLVRRLNIAPEKVAIELKDVGNTTSSTIPIALARSVLHNSQQYKRVLVSGFGVGLSWASSVLFRADLIGRGK